MKNKKLVSLVAAGALMANLALVAAVSAVTDNTSLDQAITAGTLSIDAIPSDQTWSSVGTALTAQAQTINTAADSLKYSDLRGAPSVYSLTADNTTFTDHVNGLTFSEDQLKVKGHDAGQPVNLAGSTECNLSEAGSNFVVLAGAGAWMYRDTVSSSRVMQCGASPEFEITVPARQDVGTYTTTLTWSLS